MTDSVPFVAWLEGFGADALAFIFSVLLVIGYYAHFRIQSRKDSTYSIHSVNALARRLWTQNVMTNAGKDIMAVQTLRNFIMVGILMASTASLLIMGTLTLSGQAENIVHSWNGLGMFGSHSRELWIIKVICLLVDFIVAFFSYAMSIRLATHVLFMLNVPQASYIEYPELSHECVANRLIQAGNMISLGMRAFLFAIPLVFWLFGPVFLFLSTIGLVITLNRLDRHEAASSRPSLPSRIKVVPDRDKGMQGSVLPLAFPQGKSS
jgi:uncharacterized membrane protein